MLAHLVSLGFTGFVAYTSYISRPNVNTLPHGVTNWFAWHPALMSAAFAFLAAEAVFMVSRKKSILGADASRNSKVIGHWMLMGLAVTCAVLGFLAVYKTKEAYGKQHLATPHGLLGCATVCYIIVQSCAGWNLIFNGLAKKFVDLKFLRKMHGLSGCFLLLLATLTLLGGLTSDWFKERVAGPAWYACIASPLIVYALIVMQIFSSKEPSADKKMK